MVRRRERSSRGNMGPLLSRRTMLSTYCARLRSQAARPRPAASQASVVPAGPGCVRAAAAAAAAWPIRGCGGAAGARCLMNGILMRGPRTGWCSGADRCACCCHRVEYRQHPPRRCGFPSGHDRRSELGPTRLPDAPRKRRGFARAWGTAEWPTTPRSKVALAMLQCCERDVTDRVCLAGRRL